ncbi:HET-domain-containing protein, partial [Phaeosphaeriaceae sp. SRC1lsM3a]
VLGPKQYHYHPLKEMEFRLVKVLPERMSVLKTELLHQSLDDSLDYIAISYAWGDSMDTEELFLDGAKVPVATSLYYALTAVRRKKSEVLVWVDALCIDQQNADERATQVRLMGHIYSKATSVAVWLGPEADESELAMDLLQDVSDDQVSPARERATQERIRSTTKYPESAALFALFKREYWKRLWCIQEVLLAKQTMVYCGDAVYPWDIYKKAAQAFWGSDSDPHVRQGPSSFPDKDALMQLGDASLLEVMRTCRKQLSENPRDKVFGILGLLPVATQREFPVDYSQSVKTVYTDVVDYLISTTDQLDVIRESIHFPIHVSNAGLPTWCPDWSYIPQVSGLSRNLGFDASKGTRARYKFHDKRRKLEIVGIKLDVIKFTGVAVGTFCSSQDYLTAFLHWRAIMLHGLNDEAKKLSHPLHKIFCRTLCLGQVPEDHVLRGDWHEVCYHVFAYLTKTKFPQLALDSDLLNCASATGLIEPDARRKFLQVHFGNRMMGRSFCITEHGLMGMGSGYMTTEDLVVVPFGCCTPIILRPEGRRNEYRYIGDIYVDGYMHGEAIEEWEAGRGSNEAKYILC